ncbi:hypothetical protein SS50377_25231 [Spironucleus salmonicida]|uniref:Uncharacterized protein n=1 Tax=Spironucleus salmonicida TaxID=348837 RepID=A0A9P8LRU6_9EUKA|nr:hypothetical protein SS50377_25231 [Spironucleus salmonicida]
MVASLYKWQDLGEITKSTEIWKVRILQWYSKTYARKSFNGAIQKSGTEKHSVKWRDSIMCCTCFPRARTVRHILPYTALEIVQFITEKKHYTVDYSDNRVGNSFV